MFFLILFVLSVGSNSEELRPVDCVDDPTGTCQAHLFQTKGQVANPAPEEDTIPASADISGLLQTKVKVSDLEAEGEAEDAKVLMRDQQRSKLLADRAYFGALMDNSLTTYMADVPVYNTHDLPGGLHPSELETKQLTTLIVAFGDASSMDGFCVRLNASANPCKCLTEETAIDEAIVTCSRSELNTFLQTEKASGHPEPKFIESSVRQDPWPIFEDSYDNAASLLQSAQRGPTAMWGLDRIDGETGTDDTYTVYPGSNEGSTAHVYVADTGIYVEHPDFEGRAQNTAECTAGSGSCTTCSSSSDADCGRDLSGHGTHCAGTIGGKTYGVAKKVNIYNMKVLNPSGWSSDIVASVDWVISNGNKPAVWSASLGGGGNYAAYEQAFQVGMQNGVIVSVAAGNQNSNACNYSPAFAPSAITVGSTDSDDERSYFSNYGSCVDIFAPGRSIKSASAFSSGSSTKSGTSMACPHVSGVLALFLSDMSNPDPAAAEAKMIELSKSGEVIDLNGSPDRMLYTGGNTNPLGPPMPYTPAVINPPESSRTYSSVHNNEPPGVGHARSMLDSPQAWSAKQPSVGEWMKMDLGEVVKVEGVVTQGRAPPKTYEYVTSFTVSVSTDDINWVHVGSFQGSTDQGHLSADFQSAVEARYVKLVVQTWEQYISFRAGVKVNLECNFNENSPPEVTRTYSSVYTSSAPGTGYARSALDSPQAWSAANENLPQWVVMDVGSGSWINGIVTQARLDMPWEYIKTFTVEYSLDGQTWTGIGGTYTGSSSIDKVQATFPMPVYCRYVKVVAQTYNTWMSLRVGVLKGERPAAPTFTTTTAGYVAPTTSQYQYVPPTTVGYIAPSTTQTGTADLRTKLHNAVHEVFQKSADDLIKAFDDVLP